MLPWTSGMHREEWWIALCSHFSKTSRVLGILCFQRSSVRFFLFFFNSVRKYFVVLLMFVFVFQASTNLQNVSTHSQLVEALWLRPLFFIISVIYTNLKSSKSLCCYVWDMEERLFTGAHVWTVSVHECSSIWFSSRLFIHVCLSGKNSTKVWSTLPIFKKPLVL